MVDIILVVIFKYPVLFLKVLLINNYSFIFVSVLFEPINLNVDADLYESV